MNTNKKYDDWCEEISKVSSRDDLVNHLREHAGKHYNKYDRTSHRNLNKWLISTLNLAHILEKKLEDITIDDKLFSLCDHDKNHSNGPEASFDASKFMDEYDGDLKFK